MKKNCWEFKGCGMSPDMAVDRESMVCPVVFEQKLSGVHGGKNAGRCCWVVAATMCQTKDKGENKLVQCLSCEFYRSVKVEETASGTFQNSKGLLRKLRGKE
jgi:hypothetical protein